MLMVISTPQDSIAKFSCFKITGQRRGRKTGLKYITNCEKNKFYVGSSIWIFWKKININKELKKKEEVISLKKT